MTRKTTANSLDYHGYAFLTLNELLFLERVKECITTLKPIDGYITRAELEQFGVPTRKNSIKFGNLMSLQSIVGHITTMRKLGLIHTRYLGLYFSNKRQFTLTTKAIQILEIFKEFKDYYPDFYLEFKYELASFIVENKNLIVTRALVVETFSNRYSKSAAERSMTSSIVDNLFFITNFLPTIGRPRYYTITDKGLDFYKRMLAITEILEEKEVIIQEKQKSHIQHINGNNAYAYTGE